MLKNYSDKVMLAVLFLMVITGYAYSGEWPRTGIGFRGSHWDITDNSGTVVVDNYYEDTKVNVGGFGGAFYLYTQLKDQLYAEFTIGGYGDVESRVEYWDGEEVDATAVAPILFGLRYRLFPDDAHKVLKPYVGVGAGPYWVSDVNVKDRHHYEKVKIDHSAVMGGYVAAGLDVMLNKRFGFNYDMKYHVADFDSDEYHNGLEIGIGITFAWGKEK